VVDCINCYQYRKRNYLIFRGDLKMAMQPNDDQSRSQAESNPVPTAGDRWRDFVKGAANINNGASAVYAMARMILPGAAPLPPTNAATFSAPPPPQLPAKLPLPYTQGKPKGIKYANDVDPTSKESNELSGDPPPSNKGDGQFVVDPAKRDAWVSDFADRKGHSTGPAAKGPDLPRPGM
jgi:hypothetical protein